MRKDYFTLVQKDGTSVVVIKNGKDRTFTLNLMVKITNISPAGEDEFAVSALKNDGKTEMIIVSVKNGKAAIKRRWNV